MSPTSSSSDPQRLRKVSIRRRTVDPNTLTASAADAALQQVVERRDRRRLGLPPRPAVVQATAASVSAVRVRAPVRPTPTGVPLPWRIVRVLVFVSATVVLWQAVVGGTTRRSGSPGGTGCDVMGTVTFEGKPLAQAVLELHPRDGGRPHLIETDDRGGFARPASGGLVAGRHAVVIRSGCVMPRPGAEVGTPVVIPSRYTRPDSTPLEVVVAPAARIEIVLAR